MRKFAVALTTAALLFAGIGSAAADPVAPKSASDIASAATGSVDPAALINAISAAGAGFVGSNAGTIDAGAASAAAAGTLLAPVGQALWCAASAVFSAAPCA